MSGLHILLDEEDFQQLASTSMQWAGHGWEEQDGRFIVRRQGEFIRYDLAYVYWFGDAASFLLARDYLRSQGAQYQELFDEAAACGGCRQPIDHDPYVLTTDYETESWKTTREGGRTCPHHDH